jgi:hypothetical protein
MMIKHTQGTHRKGTTVLWVALVLALMVGCQTSGSTVADRSVPKGNQIPVLDGGPHAGTFITRDMSIAYEYMVKEGKLHISGTSDLKYRQVEKLSMTLYYLDGNGSVIDYYRFFPRPRKIKQGKVMDNTFSREFDIPPEAKAFSIGYTGKTRQSGAGKSWVFQHSPFL